MPPTFFGQRDPSLGSLRITALIILLSALGALEVPAQSVAEPKAGAAQTPQGIPVTRRFRSIELGMDLDAVVEALEADELFAYRGPEDVSLLPTPNQSLIEAGGLSFVKRGYFQFLEGRLWVMILVLNPDKIDHYSIYTSLSAKYGKPAVLDPRESRWEDDSSRLSLERPLTLRYMDLETFTRLRDSAAAKESAVELDRRAFLDGL